MSESFGLLNQNYPSPLSVNKMSQTGDSIGVPQQLQRSDSVSSRNSHLVEGAYGFLERLKLETAMELGIQNYESLDKGSLPARVNGSIGGQMTRKLVALAEQTLAKQGQ